MEQARVVTPGDMVQQHPTSMERTGSAQIAEQRGHKAPGMITALKPMVIHSR